MITKRLLTLFVMALALCSAIIAKNTKTSVEQVISTITVTADEDYVVTGKTPFVGDGMVNIENTTHGVLILERVKPSLAIKNWLANHVQIKGQKAVDGQNCQVRLYGTMGSMILPYSASDKPLTVYSEQDFQGDECSDFGLENDGGYMVTLTEKKLNNRIRSFRLKRGYMVTFATRKSGYGYQRCFIANDADLEMSTLPQILDGKISSYRIFRWNTAGKKGLASNTDANTCAALGVISCYGWDTGKNMYPDVECVVNHIYEDYPTSAACGSATWSCHMKTNNEPRNSADDKPQSLNTILDNWQNLMRTGMRLCSPSSWDGSDYTDGSGFLKQFFDSIDARGWRCDLADLHCYWLVDVFDKIGTMQSKYKRPIWVSEWIWGASWNKNGIFESGKTKWDNEWAVKTICSKLNGMGYVERYFYWNSEGKSDSKLYVDGGLTPAGKWYAEQLTGMGYNSSYEKVPNTPRMRGGFRDFRVSTSEGRATITWHDYDGEYNQVMEVLRKEPGGAWQVWQTVKPDDEEADYSITDEQWTDGVRYRLHIRSFSGRDYFSSQDMEPGEAIETSNGLRYVGGNVIANGQFRMGLYGWTNGTGTPIGQPWFEVFPQSLSDGFFLQAFANHGKDGEGSLKTAFDILPQQDYVLRLAGKDIGDYVKLDVRTKGESSDENRLTFANKSYWNTQQGIFNSGKFNEALLAFRWLAGTAQLGDIELYRLFENQEDALADGVEQARKRAQAVMQWNTTLPALNTELEEKMAAASGTNIEMLNSLNLAIDSLLKAIGNKQAIDSLLNVANAVGKMDFDGRETLEEAVSYATTGLATASQFATARKQLQQALDQFLPMTEAASQPKSPSFATADGWTTKAGTYQQGDQRTATQQDKTCWNAWWSGVNAEEGTKQSMEIFQKMGGLPEGLYALECKASTQHYCLSDQHGYIRTESEQAVTPQLGFDYLDVPGTISSWQTLTSTPIYVSSADSLTIGFIGTKQGAVDNAWHRYGKPDEQPDKREGWWCATDFRLLYHPLYKFDVTPQQWGTICLPYAYRIPAGVKLYKLAGLLSDYSCVCLEEVSEVESGNPYIFISQQPQLVYYPYGEAAKRPVTLGTNNLSGTFVAYGNVAAGSYVLKDDGEWYRVAEDNRPKNASYSAIIRKANGMTILDSWDGIKMPIHGVTEELGETNGIAAPTTASPTESYYTIGGRPTTEKPAGIHIKLKSKQAVKVLK